MSGLLICDSDMAGRAVTDHPAILSPPRHAVNDFIEAWNVCDGCCCAHQFHFCLVLASLVCFCVMIWGQRAVFWWYMLAVRTKTQKMHVLFFLQLTHVFSSHLFLLVCRSLLLFWHFLSLFLHPIFPWLVWVLLLLAFFWPCYFTQFLSILSFLHLCLI